MSADQSLRILCGMAICLAVTSHGNAQLRPDSPPVLEPSQAPREARSPTQIALQNFPRQYLSAGSPRVTIYWNTRYDDQLKDERGETETTSTTRSRKHSSLDETTSGDAGGAKISEGEVLEKEDKKTIKGSVIMNRERRPTGLSEQQALELESAFMDRLRAERIRLVSRSASMRAARHSQKAGGEAATDSKFIETQALLATSEMVIEVLLVRDPQAPLGIGFRSSVLDIKASAEILSAYSLGLPIQTRNKGRYVATNRGFEWASPALTVSDVGRTAAEDLLVALGPALTTRVSSARSADRRVR